MSLPNHQVLYRILCFSIGWHSSLVLYDYSWDLVIWWSPWGQRQELCSSCSLQYLQRLSQGLTWSRCSLNDWEWINEQSNEQMYVCMDVCMYGRMDGWMLWKERFPRADAVALSKQTVSPARHLACCTKCPACLPSCTQKLLKGIINFLSPECSSHKLSDSLWDGACIGHEWRGTSLCFKVCLGMRGRWRKSECKHPK